GCPFSSPRRLVREHEEANRCEQEIGAVNKIAFHAADFSRFFADNKGFAAAVWKASTTLMTCTGTRNLERVGQCRQQGAADVPSEELRPDSSAGKMPAAPCGFMESPLSLFACIGIMNRWPSRTGRKAPINRTHSKRFALAAESVDDASAFGVRASSAPLSQAGCDSMDEQVYGKPPRHFCRALGP